MAKAKKAAKAGPVRDGLVATVEEATATRKIAKRRGPCVAAACFCENVIEDKSDGAMSLIRIIDKITITLQSPPAPPDFPSDENRLGVNIIAFVSLKAGDSPGEHAVRMEMVSPSGKRNPPWVQQITFPAEPTSGANIRMNSVIYIVAGGLFWLEVFVDDKLLTCMPLQILINKVEGPGQAAPTAPQEK
jgi:hypothetical protein